MTLLTSMSSIEFQVVLLLILGYRVIFVHDWKWHVVLVEFCGLNWNNLLSWRKLRLSYSTLNWLDLLILILLSLLLYLSLLFLVLMM